MKPISPKYILLLICGCLWHTLQAQKQPDEAVLDSIWQANATNFKKDELDISFLTF